MGDDPTRTLQGPVPGAPTHGTPVLVVISGMAQQRMRIPAEGLVVGRGEGVDLRLEADGVSRKHFRILGVAAGLFNVLDLGSTNGTFVNGRRIDVSVLRHGDELQVGQVVMRFAYEAEGETWEPTAASPEPGVHPLAEKLTARELEIAQLVAKGLTNAEIGKRLFISPRTVSTHLANIYERLEIRTRAALASLFVEYQLAGSRSD